MIAVYKSVSFRVSFTSCTPLALILLDVTLADDVMLPVSCFNFIVTFVGLHNFIISKSHVNNNNPSALK